MRKIDSRVGWWVGGWVGEELESFHRKSKDQLQSKVEIEVLQGVSREGEGSVLAGESSERLKREIKVERSERKIF